MEYNTPLINGINHVWGDISVVLFGRKLVGITAVKYDEEQDKENVYGAGNNPVSRGYGNKKSTASITLATSEISALELVAPNGNLTDIPPFDVIVSFMNTSQPVTTHVLKNCEFTKNGRDAKQNDTKLEMEMPLVLSHIIWKP